MIPYGKHYIDEDDIAAVADVLRGGWITQGPKIEELESVISEYTGAKYAVAVSSGTAALHLACMVAGLSPGKKAVTSANTFVASANCIEYVGATAVLCDIDADTLNLDIGKLADLVREDADIEVVIPVHFGGLPCDMQTLSSAIDAERVRIIEDASHALGARYPDGSMVGNCRYSDMTVFSLHPVKGVTAGEGGIITTNSEALFAELQLLRSHGICKGNFDFPGVSVPGNDLAYPEEALDGEHLKPWYYEMQFLGYNYRITDIQCALVLSQMKKIDMFLNARKQLVAIYDEQLPVEGIIATTQSDTRSSSSNHIYVARINYQGVGKTRAQVMRELSEKGIGTQVHYIPVARHPYYRNQGYTPSHYPVAESYYSEALTLPVYYDLQVEQVHEIINTLHNILSIN